MEKIDELDDISLNDEDNSKDRDSILNSITESEGGSKSK